MHRTDYDFDVITGPATLPPPPRPVGAVVTGRMGEVLATASSAAATRRSAESDLPAARDVAPGGGAAPVQY